MTPAPTRAFLMDLDSELSTNGQLIDRAIIIQGLLSRQIALVESNLFDSPAIRSFFTRHQRTLSAMAEHPSEYEVPLLASAARTGRDIYAGLDQLLARGEPAAPVWLSSLSQDQNEALRSDYGALKHAAQRRARLVAILGDDFAAYLDLLSRYVGASEAPTVVAALNAQTPGLYERVASSATVALAELSGQKNAPYREVAEKLITAIHDKPPAEWETRERLHRAIYDWEIFYANRGVVRRGARRVPADVARDEWRFLVNTHWGQHIADRIGLADTHHADWFDLGRLGEALRMVHFSGAKPRRVDTVRLATALDAADFDFVVSVRKEKAFWESLEMVESARSHTNAEARLTAWLRHVEFVSNRLAAHLTASGEKVEPTLNELLEVPIAGLSLATGLAAGGVVVYHTLDWGAALATGFNTATSTSGGFYFLQALFGKRKIRRQRLKAFRNEFRALRS